ncbi:MAG: ABC-F family ATP-binding cassette domain-containing protein [Myxococcota bacterium]
MPYLLADGLSLRYGPRVLFEDAHLSIEAKDRWGVVGPNGAGKSSLLEILAGRKHPDGGSVHRAKDVRVGYLAQEHGEVPEARLIEHIMDGAPGKDALEAKIEDVETELAAAEEESTQVELGGLLGELHEELADMDTLFGRHEAERIAMGLGFELPDFGRSIGAFSGGWRMRAAMARLLFERNHVLILDEPTNHLDVPTVEWLSDFIDGRPMTLLLTTHDPSFLDRHVNRIASLEVDGLETFRGNYGAFVAHRQQRLEELQNRWERFQRKKKEITGFIDRFRAKASKARQAASKEKMIEKLEDELVEPPRPRRTISIRFPPAPRSPQTVLHAKGLSFGYGEDPLFQGLDFEVRRGQRIGLLGVNGSGKSTLLKLMAEELTPGEGQVELGSGVKRRYFAQHQADTLRAGSSILEAVWEPMPELGMTEVRSLCGAFLFQDDEVEKPIDVLSGGERARVAMARVLIRPGNLLLLDEPTNHLDTDSAERLIDSLAAYDGTLIFISHSLAFVRRLATTLWVVNGGRVQVHPGSFDDYLAELAEARGSRREASRSPKPDKAARMEARRAEKAKEAERRRLRREVKASELEVEALETQKAELEAILGDPEAHADPERSRRLSEQHQDVERRLEAQLEAWTDLVSRLEAVTPGE